LTTKDNLLIRGLKNAETRVKAFGQQMAGIGLKLSAAGGALLAPIAKVFDFAAGRAAKFADMSDRFNVPVERLSALAYAFERGGVEIDEFGSTLDQLQAKMFSAADGADDTFRRLGLNARAFATLPLDQQLETLVDRINALADPMDRAAVGTEMFGSAWRELSTSSLRSGDALRALTRDAKNAGAVISAEDAMRGRDAMRGLNQLWVEFKSTVMEVGLALLPTSSNVRDITDVFRMAGQAVRDWIRNNRGLIQTVATIAAAVTAGGAALYGLGTAFGVAGTAAGMIVSALGLIGTALGALLSPVGLVVAAIGVMALNWDKLKESGQNALSSLTSGFREMGAMFKEVWGGIVSALQSGDLERAAKIVGVALEVVWTEVMLYMTEQWISFKNSLTTGFDEIISIAGVVAGAISKIGDALDFVSRTFRQSLLGWQALMVHIETGSYEKARQFVQEAEAAMDEMDRHDERSRRTFRTAQIADAAAERDRMRQRLRELIAMGGSGGSPTGKSAAEINDSMYDPKANKPGAALIDPIQTYQSTKGTFSSSNLSGMLGVGNNVGQRQLKTQEQIRDRLDKTNALLGKLGIATFK